MPGDLISFPRSLCGAELAPFLIAGLAQQIEAVAHSVLSVFVKSCALLVHQTPQQPPSHFHVSAATLTPVLGPVWAAGMDATLVAMLFSTAVSPAMSEDTKVQACGALLSLGARVILSKIILGAAFLLQILDFANALPDFENTFRESIAWEQSLRLVCLASGCGFIFPSIQIHSKLFLEREQFGRSFFKIQPCPCELLVCNWQENWLEVH
jgi:hypothetical protein